MHIPIRYAQVIPFFPLIQFVRIQSRYGWLSRSQWKVLPLWFVKCLLIEPLRLFEAIVMAILPDKKPSPVFILGFYRSGTTYLQELLSANKSHRTLTLFQSVLPEISLCFGWLFEPIFSFVARFLRIKNEFHNIPLYGKFPGEDDVAITAFSSLHDYNKIFQYPSRHEVITDHYLKFCSEKEAARWKDLHLYLTKKLAYIYGNKQLILKSPPNTGRVAVLNTLYPGSRFVFISRQPADTIQSSKRLWRLNQRFSFETYTEEQAELILLHQYITLHELFFKQRTEAACCEIRFDELVHDSVATLEKVYAALSLSGWNEAEHLVRKINVLRRQHVSQTYNQQSLILNGLSTQFASVTKKLGYEK